MSVVYFPGDFEAVEAERAAEAGSQKAIDELAALYRDRLYKFQEKWKEVGSAERRASDAAVARARRSAAV